MRVLAFFLLIAVPAAARNNGSDKAIAAVSKSATAYEEDAMAKSGLPAMQNIVGVVGLNNGIERRKCTIPERNGGDAGVFLSWKTKTAPSGLFSPEPERVGRSRPRQHRAADLPGREAV